MRGSKRLPDAEYEKRWVETRKLKSTTNEQGCWLWNRSLAINGYGQTGYRAITIRIHRKSYEIANKVTLTPDQLVCHTCDNKTCWNPAHLWIGTHKDNNQDCADKGRHYEGSRTHCERGHPFSGDNLLVYKQDVKSGKTGIRRVCKKCQLGRLRMKKLGWSEEMAFSDIKVPPGFNRFGQSSRGRKYDRLR